MQAVGGKNRCPICLGAGVERCPLHSTPIVAKTRAALSKGSFFGDSPPSIFVGNFGYPRVRAGVLAPPLPGHDDLDSPSKWFSDKLSIPEISEKRLSLLNMTFSAEIKRPALSREYFGEVSLAVKPTEVEARTRSLREGLSFDKYSSPLGPSASLEEFKVTENPKIPSKVDSILSENLRAEDGANELFNYGFDVYYIQRLLSGGFLGKKKTLVPTRWGITATDSIVSERLISEIRELEKIDRALLFTSKHLDNEFHILLFPGQWSFEQLEGYVPGETLMQDWEYYEGRKKYASNVAGGYYAGRIAVCEYLAKVKRQASALIVRSIGEGYFAPLGVWQVRENVRNAMESPPREFPDLPSALQALFSESRVKKERILTESKLLKFALSQKRLDFF